uniref:Uncharacterized protein n=1 Tax=Setaria italica TaxID=4555 RepID=K3Y4B2_SETIT
MELSYIANIGTNYKVVLASLATANKDPSSSFTTPSISSCMACTRTTRRPASPTSLNNSSRNSSSLNMRTRHLSVFLLSRREHSKWSLGASLLAASGFSYSSAMARHTGMELATAA